MHDTSYYSGKLFFDLYWKDGSDTIVDIGSYDVNGSLRDFQPAGTHYVGLDIEKGPGVDLVIDINLPLPLADRSADLIVSTSVFEHDRFFWISFLEMCRIAKEGGFIYIAAPSNGPFHRYPQDYWRFYPDAALALEAWGKKNGYPLTLIESFVGTRNSDCWNDFCAVFELGKPTPRSDDQFLSSHIECANIHRFDIDGIGRENGTVEDMAIIARLNNDVSDLNSSLKDASVLQIQHKEKISSMLESNQILALDRDAVSHAYDNLVGERDILVSERKTLFAETVRLSQLCDKAVRELVGTKARTYSIRERLISWLTRSPSASERSAMRWLAEKHFDPDYYLAHNGDVLEQKLQPDLHFIRHGCYEGRKFRLCER